MTVNGSMNIPIRFNRLDLSMVIEVVRRNVGGALVWVVMISIVEHSSKNYFGIASEYSSSCVAHIGFAILMNNF